MTSDAMSLITVNHLISLQFLLNLAIYDDQIGSVSDVLFHDNNGVNLSPFLSLLLKKQNGFCY